MDKILILAYMGTGKTEVSKKYNDVIDFDFQDYKYIYDESISHLPLEQRKGSTNLRTVNINYPHNFLSAAKESLNRTKIVVSPFIEHVFKAYNDSNIKEEIKNLRIILVCPPIDNLEEYIKRFTERGNSTKLIERRKKEFPRLIELFEQATEYEKIIIKPGQFLKDALKEYGINLELKK